MELAEAKALVASVPHWHHAFEIFPGLVTPGSYQPSFLFNKMGLPSALTGLRVLDIGASDGYFSLQFARRGAHVVAIDYRRKEDHGYHIMERLNPDVAIEYHQMNIYDLRPEKFGDFDIILFLGVLYHLPDMVRALYLIRQCCRRVLFLETHSENDFCPSISAARYYQGNSLNKDYTNFWAPNRLCVRDMLYDAGFDIEGEECWGQRMFAKAGIAVVDGIRREKMRLGYGLIGAQ